jgi:hypothetical protein
MVGSIAEKGPLREDEEGEGLIKALPGGLLWFTLFE